jgi:hypothetical protein
MLHQFKQMIFWAFWLCAAPAFAWAQGESCPAMVEKALTAADLACQSTGRNQACYGNVALSAEPQPGVDDFTFSKTGDLVSVADLRTLRLSPMNLEGGTWGVALLRLQANLPDTIPGQNVTFLLFGDVEITNAVNPELETDLNPMQAFYLKTAAGDAQCEEAPESGMLVQTPEGAGEVMFNVNGVDVEMGSTVFFQSEQEEGLTVSTLEGAAYVTSDDQTQVIVPGTWARIPIRQRMVPFRAAGGGVVQLPTFDSDGAPEPPKSYQGSINKLNALPIRLLERPVEIARPLTEEEVQKIRELTADGGPLCGEAPLPSCDKVPQFQQDNRECVFRPRSGDPPLRASETRPFCPDPTPDAPVDDRPCVMRPGPNDPPLPASETRPFCPPPAPGEAPPPPPDTGDLPLPPVGLIR